jgi:hypothetical protein
MAMDLGLDQPGALDRLFIVLDDIQRIDERVGAFFDDPSAIERDDNGIGELVTEHQDPHVDIRRTILAALGGLRGSLTNVRTQVTSVPSTPEVLATLCRTALLASCRLLVLVGPLDIKDRKRNAVRVMLQESSGLYWVYKRAQDFKASLTSRVTGESFGRPSSTQRSMWRSISMMPTASRLERTAIICVSTSSHSRPESSMRWMPCTWPSIRRNRVVMPLSASSLLI